MKQIIKQLTIIITGGAMALSFGCGIDDLIDDVKDEIEDEVAFAPTSLSGKTIHGSRTQNAGFFDTPGSFTLSFINGNSFVLVDTGGTDQGTYTYTKTSSITGTVVLTQTGVDGTVNVVATFTSATGGTYIMVEDGEPETGTFTMN